MESLPYDAPASAYERQAEGMDRQAIAHHYGFGEWQGLLDFAARVGSDPSVRRFEAAVDAIVHGDLASLTKLLNDDPSLTDARSARDHHATLLHYVAANGTEDYRQKTPPNAGAILKLLLDRGAKVDALATLYGGQCTTLSLLVSSCHPANAGLQVALTETLLDYGAAIDGEGDTQWKTPLTTALIFGYLNTADRLAERGARVDTLEAAAGLGRVEDVRTLLPQASPMERQRAFALAAQSGRTEVVRVFLDAGEDPNRFNPEGMHAHSTPLHQAALAGRLDVVQLLAERGARLDIADKIWESTPLGWAIHGQQSEVERFLRSLS